MTDFWVSLLLYGFAALVIGIPLSEVLSVPGYRPDWMNRLIEWWQAGKR